MTAGQREDRKRKLERLGPLPRPAALAVLAIWAGLTIWALIGLIGASSIWSGAREGLVPVQHRAARGQPLALVRVDPEALAAASPVDPASAPPDATELDASAVLADAASAIEEALGEQRIPLAPPKAEINRWLDAHALYLLPIETHESLAARLSDASMLAEVQGLEARLSSPLFSVSGEQPRRDPLGIRELTKAEVGRLGHVAEIPGSDDPQVSPSGDLLAASGDRVLIALRSDRSPEELLLALRSAVQQLPVEVALIDPGVIEAATAQQLAGADQRWGDGPTVTIAGFAALVLLLSLVMRRLIPVLALALCLASVWVISMFAIVELKLIDGGLGGGVELGSAALLLVLLGFACDAALRLQRIGVGGWASLLITAGALLPLLLTPYPLWQRWALIWPAVFLLSAGVMRVVLPSLLELSRGDFEWRRPGFRLAPMPVLAVGICVALTAAGAWANQQLRYRPGTRLPTAVSEAATLERELIEHFFDPTMIVEAHSSAEHDPKKFETPEAAALDAAASDVATLAQLVPVEARRIDSPGSFVLPHEELLARKRALQQLKLGERMEALELLLTDQGLRAEAFGEFVRGATDIEDLPSAQAALDGPLGPWIAGYMHDDVLRSRVELRGREGLPSIPLTDERMAELPRLRGPAIAAMVDQREFDDRLGLAMLAGLWLSAFLVWLGTGSLGIAVSVALVAVASECGVLFGLSLLDQSVGPHLLPILMVVGAAAAVAGGRACRAVSLGQPIVARGQLLSGGCQVVIGVVLLTSAQPVWRELGLALAMGSALACGLGLFATPGLAMLFEKLRRRPRTSAEKGGGDA
ncbi:MAG TPA: hypothetical protein VM869_32465 [Enhygromyxa sp.]|nr:hypothetical protein [Enhygromyxa sp.]